MKAPMSQDLRRRLYLKAKAERQVLISLAGELCAGARNAGNAYATCDVVGARNRATASPTRARRETPIQAKDEAYGLLRPCSTLPRRQILWQGKVV